jgi:DNA-binding transcriptional LysR family regulator
MDVRHLELLRELADRKSVAAVAAATHRTPSAVSQQLRTATREFGVPLVEHTGRGLRLTDAGKLLAQGSVSVLRALAEVQADLDKFRGEPTGHVSIAALPSAAAFLLPDVIAELRQTGIELECTDLDIAEEDYPALVADFDIVIGHSLRVGRSARVGDLLPVSGRHEQIVTTLLAREPLDIAMRTGHELAGRKIVTLEQLVRAEWYGVPLGYPFDTVRIAVERATGEQVRVVQRIRDNRLIEALVRGSDRLAILPRFTTPTGTGIELRPISGIDAARHVLAYQRRDHAARLAVGVVLGQLRAAGERADSASMMSARHE